MAKAKLTRKEQKEQTQTKILNAALEEFSQEGYGGANIRAISARANVNHGLIKYYFGSKEKLWQRAVEYMFERSRAETLFDHELEPAEGIKAYIRSYTKYCANHPEHARLMIQASMHSNDRLRWTVEHQLLPHKDALMDNIDRQKELGLWPDVPNISIIYTIVSACQLIFALGTEVSSLYGTDVYDEQFVEDHANAVIELLTRQHKLPLN